ncbi:heparan-alpha-glucosaminide N-acetyltransferase domain-containing protein [Mumia qirimensis]|uniref:heparan-alpha-glucosaminide N-acetyltransferase domain-containing protein n=1 Tax=Mumia qirimensis TaxID=3234852 RepID=UPI00351D0274
MSSATGTRGTGRSTITSTRRLLGVDAARAIALIGMMATHLEPKIGGDGEVSTAHLLAAGRASALFALLAGVGIALASGGTTPPRGRGWAGSAAATAARAGVIFAVGLFLAAFDSGLAVILCYYGVLFLVALPVLPLRAGWLLGIGAAWTVLGPVLSQWLRHDDPMSLDVAVPNLVTLLTDPVGTASSVVLTGYYPVLTWTAYLLVGMGIGRLPLGRTAVAAAIAAGGTVLAVAAYAGSSRWLTGGGLAELEAAGTGGHLTTGPIDADVLHVAFYGTTPTTTWSWLGIASPHSGAPPDLLQTLGSALAVLGVMLLLERVTGRALWPVAAIGSMTFTLYTLHVVLVATLLPPETDDALLIHVAIAAATAIPWRRYVGRGPLEALAAAAARRARQAVVDPSPAA